MIQRNCSVCILGGGPAALLSQALLLRKGISSCIFAKSVLGNLAPLRVGEVRITPIPIFVSPETHLFRQLTLGQLTDSDYVTTNYSPEASSDVSDNILPGSYAEFILQQYPDGAKRLIITKKHLGTLPFRCDLPGLRRKVLSHYPPGHLPPRRVGFNEGISPYLRSIERVQCHQVVNEDVLAVDVDKQRIITKSYQVTYERLISTLPLLDFLALAAIKTPLTTVGGDAQMVVASTRQLKGRNQLIYDCDATSPVYRAFIPRDNVVVAQVARAHWDIKDLAIAARVQELFAFSDRPIVVKRLTVRSCYPLGLSDYSLRDVIIADLEQLGVTLFGRLAQWEYLDLEELDWERIECLF